jgi:hypothetical protein
VTIASNTAELYSSHIPALATLVSLGWDYLSPEDCLAARGGNQEVVLRVCGGRRTEETSGMSLVLEREPC